MVADVVAAAADVAAPADAAAYSAGLAAMAGEAMNAWNPSLAPPIQHQCCM